MASLGPAWRDDGGAGWRGLARALGVGLAAAAVAVGGRYALGLLAPGMVPFALVFPAVLAASLLAGWRAGLLTLVVGVGASQVLFADPRNPLSVHMLNLLLVSGASAAVIVLAQIYKATRQALSRAEAARSEEAEATIQALRRSEMRLRMALEAGRMAAWAVDANGALEPSPSLNRLIGLDETATPDPEWLRSRYPEGDLERLEGGLVEALTKGERYFEVEYQFRRANGELNWFNLRSEILGPLTAPEGAIGVVLDVTDRRHMDDSLRLLAREVDHRANNLMAVVQSAIALSNAEDAETLKTVISGRVQALARAHQLIAESRWQGASLERLVEEELRPYAHAEAGPVGVGPPVELDPHAAQTVAMVLHELATNAAKYGALSRPEGRVSVTWTLDDETVALRWAEQGGPPVTQPSRQGFGTTVLQRSLGGPLKGSTTMTWAPEGLICDLRFRPVAGPQRPIL